MKLSQVFKRKKQASGESFTPAQFGLNKEEIINQITERHPDDMAKLRVEKMKARGWSGNTTIEQIFTRKDPERGKTVVKELESGRIIPEDHYSVLDFFPSGKKYVVKDRSVLTPIRLPKSNECNCAELLDVPHPENFKGELGFHRAVVNRWTQLWDEPDEKQRALNVENILSKLKRKNPAPRDEFMNHFLSHLYGAGMTHRDLGIHDIELGERFKSTQGLAQSALSQAKQPKTYDQDNCGVCNQFESKIKDSIDSYKNEIASEPHLRSTTPEIIGNITSSIIANVYDLWRNGKRVSHNVSPSLSEAQRLMDGLNEHSKSSHGFVLNRPDENYTPVIDGSSPEAGGYIHALHNRLVNRLTRGWRAIKQRPSEKVQRTRSEQGSEVYDEIVNFKQELNKRRKKNTTRVSSTKEAVTSEDPTESYNFSGGWEYIGVPRGEYTNVFKQRVFPTVHEFDPEQPLTDKIREDITNKYPEITSQDHRKLIDTDPYIDRSHLYLFQKAKMMPNLGSTRKLLNKIKFYNSREKTRLTIDNDATCKEDKKAPSNVGQPTLAVHPEKGKYKINGEIVSVGFIDSEGNQKFKSHHTYPVEINEIPNGRRVGPNDYESANGKINENGEIEYDWDDVNIPDSVKKRNAAGQLVLNPLIAFDKIGYLTKNESGKNLFTPVEVNDPEKIGEVYESYGKLLYNKSQKIDIDSLRSQGYELKTLLAEPNAKPRFLDENGDECHDKQPKENKENGLKLGGHLHLRDPNTGKRNAYKVEEIPEDEQVKPPSEEDIKSANSDYNSSLNAALKKVYPLIKSPVTALAYLKREHARAASGAESQNLLEIRNPNRIMNASKESKEMNWKNRFEKEATGIEQLIPHAVHDIERLWDTAYNAVQKTWEHARGENLPPTKPGTPQWETDYIHNNESTQALGDIGLMGVGAIGTGLGVGKGLSKARQKLDEIMYNRAVDKGAQHARKPDHMKENN
jgi:hypothetical protein